MNAHVSRWIPCLALLAVAACGRGSGGIDHHVEDLVTVSHGLYGQALSVDDVGSADEAYLPGLGVDVYAVPAGTELGAPLASATSGRRGFYELSLEAGDYVLCTSFRRCVTVTLSPGQLLRIDYEFSVGPGWSRGAPWPPWQSPPG